MTRRYIRSKFAPDDSTLQEVIRLYTEERWTLRMIGDRFNADHHRIGRILTAHGIKIDQSARIRRPISDTTRHRMSLAMKGRKSWSLGKTMSKGTLYKNMKAHLIFDVPMEWLTQFADIERLKFLNRTFMKERGRCSDGFTPALYQAFVEKFYADRQFNDIYDRWQRTGNRWMRPTLDHIHPRSRGGTALDLSNLQFLSWFENRAKADMTADEWEEVKDHIQDYLS